MRDRSIDLIRNNALMRVMEIYPAHGEPLNERPLDKGRRSRRSERFRHESEELLRRDRRKAGELNEPIKRTVKEDERIEHDADYDADRTYDDPREDTNLQRRRR